MTLTVSLSQNLARALPYLPVFVALFWLVAGGVLLLNRADAQARDTIRKHHLEDIERSLYAARLKYGTYPPYDQPTWCGSLSDPVNEAVRAQVEEALRSQNEKYGNEAKPFPTDPASGEGYDYFYWKRSPGIFELYAILEADRNAERSSRSCPTATAQEYDYGLTSVFREDRATNQP